MKFLKQFLLKAWAFKGTIKGSKKVSIENVKTKVSVTKVFVTPAEVCYPYIGKREVSEDWTNWSTGNIKYCNIMGVSTKFKVTQV